MKKILLVVGSLALGGCPLVDDMGVSQEDVNDDLQEQIDDLADQPEPPFEPSTEAPTTPEPEPTPSPDPVVPTPTAPTEPQAEHGSVADPFPGLEWGLGSLSRDEYFDIPTRENCYNDASLVSSWTAIRYVYQSGTSNGLYIFPEDLIRYDYSTNPYSTFFTAIACDVVPVFKNNIIVRDNNSYLSGPESSVVLLDSGEYVLYTNNFNSECTNSYAAHWVVWHYMRDEYREDWNQSLARGNWAQLYSGGCGDTN